MRRSPNNIAIIQCQEIGRISYIFNKVIFTTITFRHYGPYRAKIPIRITVLIIREMIIICLNKPFIFIRTKKNDTPRSNAFSE